MACFADVALNTSPPVPPSQVRFFHEVLKRLRPGVPLRALHGGMKQMKRMGVFAEFCQVRGQGQQMSVR